jgi:hypothetical protein
MPAERRPPGAAQELDIRHLQLLPHVVKDGCQHSEKQHPLCHAHPPQKARMSSGSWLNRSRSSFSDTAGWSARQHCPHGRFSGLHAHVHALRDAPDQLPGP